MKKKNLLIVLAMLIVVAALLGLASALKPAPAADGDYVLILVDNQEYDRVFLSQPRKVTVEQPDGQINIVDVSDRGAVMEFSTCHNQQCVHMGEVTLDNWEFRPNQTFIICLPNRVTVELVVKE